MARKYTELELVRREKVKLLKEQGVNPWGSTMKFSDTSKTLKEKYDQYSKDELHDKDLVASVVGRVMTMRGPLLFVRTQQVSFKHTLPKRISRNIFISENSWHWRYCILQGESDEN